MAMRVAYCCPHCKSEVSFDFGQPQEWTCPGCNHAVSLTGTCAADADTFRMYDGEPPAVRSSPSHYPED